MFRLDPGHLFHKDRCLAKSLRTPAVAYKCYCVVCLFITGRHPRTTHSLYRTVAQSEARRGCCPSLQCNLNSRFAIFFKAFPERGDAVRPPHLRVLMLMAVRLQL